MKVNILFYSMYGHMFQMVRAAKEGADKVTGVESRILGIPETLPKNVLEAMGAPEAQKQYADIPEATMDDLAKADGLIFGIPTRYGRMSPQWANFLNQSGQLWLTGYSDRQTCGPYDLFGDPARRAGIHPYKHSRLAYAPRDAGGRTLLLLSGTDGGR